MKEGGWGSAEALGVEGGEGGGGREEGGLEDEVEFEGVEVHVGGED